MIKGVLEGVAMLKDGGLKATVKLADGVRLGDLDALRGSEIGLGMTSEAPEGSEVEKYRNHEKVLTDLLAHAREMAAFHEGEVNDWIDEEDVGREKVGTREPSELVMDAQDTLLEIKRVDDGYDKYPHGVPKPAEEGGE